MSKILAFAMLFLTTACVSANMPAEVQSSATTTTPTVVERNVPLMESTRGIDYSFYNSVDQEFRDLTIPENFVYVTPNQVKYHMTTGEYQGFADRYYGFKGRYSHLGCGVILKEFRVTNARDGSEHDMLMCWDAISGMAHLDYVFMTQSMSEIILYHAQNRNVKEPYFVHDANFIQYHKYAVMQKTAEFYAYFKDLMPLSPQEHEIIQDYFDEIFMGSLFHTQERRKQCNVKNPKTIVNSNVGFNGCGSRALGLVNAGLAYAIATNNNKLFTQQKRNLTYILGTFDDEGIFTAHATRGGRSWGYHTDATMQLGQTTEILARLGYNFLEHTMPRSGIKVHEVMAKHWEIVNDHTLMDFYSKHNRGVMLNDKRNKWNTVKGMPTFKMTVWLDEKKWQEIAVNNIRYINEYTEGTTTIWGKEVDLKQVANSRRASYWYTNLFPVEYLYRINQSN